MASYARLSSSDTKDIFLQHISTDIKGIQNAQCSVSTHMDVLKGNSKHAQLLCDHLDHILMHGLYKPDDGYWPCVVYFTHTITVKEIKSLVNVSTNIGRGRSWLNIALNEQVMESYLRMFIDNQSHVKGFYAKEAFLRDVERLSLLLTLISGLDFVSFDLPNDDSYLDISASPSVSNSGIDFSIKPNFVASVTPDAVRRKNLTLSDTHSVPPTMPPVNSPAHSAESFLTSSLPAKLTFDQYKPEELEEKEDLSRNSLEIANEIPVVSLPDSLTVDPERSLFISRGKVEEHPVVGDPQPKEELPPSQQPQLSFLDRYNQVTEEKSSEELVVSKKKKSTKGRKKKKRKDIEGGIEVAGSKKKEVERDALERPSSPQSLMESLKENQPPSLTAAEDTSVISTTKDETSPAVNNSSSKETEALMEIVTPLASDRTTFEELIETATATPQHQRPLDNLSTQTFEEVIKSSTNPFDDDRANESRVVDEKAQVEHTRRTSNEYQFGNQSPTNESNIETDLSLLDSTAAFVRSRRRSPQPSENNRSMNDDTTLDAVYGNVPQVVATQEEIVGGGFSKTDEDKHKLSLDLSDGSNVAYDSPPERPPVITESEKRSCDVAIDDNTRIVLSLDIFHHSDETAIRLVQAHVPQGPGRYQKVCVVVTDGAVYLTQYDGTEGVFSHMIGVAYSMLDHILSGLSWQSFTLVYEERNNGLSKKQTQVVITGNEAVSRSIVDTITSTAATSKGQRKHIPIKSDDESRTEAIEKELIKLGSETSMEIVRYCMVYWEQLSGEPPLLSPPADISVPISGTLYVKENFLLKLQSWSVGFFQLIDGVLYHFNNENEKNPKSSYPMRGLKCGGCTRAGGENKDYAFKVLDTNGSSLVLAAEDEEDMTKWMQALCLATIGEEEAIVKSPIQKGGAYCAVLLTQNKIHVLKEDWSNGTVQLVTSISVQDVNEICVEQNLRVYCTVQYDDWENESQGMWMLCFSSEYELGQFEGSLLKKYKEIFQVDLGFSELKDRSILSRAHQAIELMRASRNRSDSITRGRTVFTFDQ